MVVDMQWVTTMRHGQILVVNGVRIQFRRDTKIAVLDEAEIVKMPVDPEAENFKPQFKRPRP